MNENPNFTNVRLLIGGEQVAATNGATFDRRNPVDGALVTVAAAAQAVDGKRAVDAADAAFGRWSETGPGERRALLLRAADALAKAGDAFVGAMQAEIGATESWARFNVHLASRMLQEAAAVTTRIEGRVIPSDKPGCLAMAWRQPAGVVLGIAPWNAPVILGVRAIATALACGNTVILKASEICPAVHALIGRVFLEAGFPPGVVNVLTNAPADAALLVETLVADERVRRVNFTGSSKVGRIIGALCGHHLKPALLELGGKAPMLVMKGADLEDAVRAATFGAFMNQGQICMSTERLIVDAAVADDFVARFAARVAVLRAGDPMSGAAPLGALVDVSSARHVTELIDDARSKGATIVVGGTSDGAIMQPTVVDHVTPAMRLYREESFGPVVAVIRVDGDDEAVRVANDSEYGLSASVFCRDMSRAIRAAKRIASGICHINGATVHDEAQMPFGGVKASGHGRFGGEAGIDHFTELRWITIETETGAYPL